MDKFTNIIFILDDVLSENRRKHILGGVLLSVSMFFGGIAFTVMTIRNEEDEKWTIMC